MYFKFHDFIKLLYATANWFVKIYYTVPSESFVVVAFMLFSVVNVRGVDVVAEEIKPYSKIQNHKSTLWHGEMV